MHILVTGGSGRIGRYTVAHLLAEGHQVRIIDREPEADLPAEVQPFIKGATYHQGDITDYPKLRPHLVGIDAVVHLAAIPFPIPDKDAEIFDINCAGTFNVYQAAAEAGIQRVVSASSINALGNGFGVRSIPIHYFPIDEEHPTWTSDVYSYSKKLVEETGAYFWRRNDISGVCMRFPWVYDPNWMPEEEIRANFKRNREEFETLQAMSETERQSTRDAVMAQLELLRQKRRRGELDWPEVSRRMRSIPYRAMFVSRKDFWAFLDVRDAAHAIHLAVTATYEGAHPLHIADTMNSTGLPVADLANLLYPDVTTWKRPAAELETLFSVDKARELIGFVPRHSVGHLAERDV